MKLPNCGPLTRMVLPSVVFSGPRIQRLLARGRSSSPAWPGSVERPAKRVGSSGRWRLGLLLVLLARRDGRGRQRVLDPENLVEDLAALRLAVLGDQRVQHLGVVELVGVVGEAARHRADVDHRHVEVGPFGRLEAELGELARQKRGLVRHDLGQPLVVAGRVAAQDVALLRRQRLDLGADLRLVEVGAGLGVVGDMLGAEHLRDGAEHRAAGHLHLEQPVLRHRVAEAGVEAVDVVGIDLRDPPFVAQDRHVGRGARRKRRKAEDHRHQ